ncbi:hypothetical protein [Mangrovibacterium sp.]|uniref:hypothetical protein n=1 Tax=Mangrovibacterium sp. TaxID=1961364 RepID=UPI003563CC12
MKGNFSKSIALFSLILTNILLHVQTEAPSWGEFAEKNESRKLVEASLSDCSSSGYHFSEKDIPDVSGWATFEVPGFWATPNFFIF